MVIHLFVLLSVTIAYFNPTPLSRHDPKTGQPVNIVEEDLKALKNIQQKPSILNKLFSKSLPPKGDYLKLWISTDNNNIPKEGSIDTVPSGSLVNFSYSFRDGQEDKIDLTGEDLYVNLYSPPYPDMDVRNSSDSSPLDYLKISEFCDNFDLKKGPVATCKNIPLFDLRTEYELRLCYGENMFSMRPKFTAYGRSDLVYKFKSSIQNVHIARTERNDQMRVMFTLPAKEFMPYAVWGRDPTDWEHKAAGISDTYTHDNLCREPAASLLESGARFRYPGYQGTILFTNLVPGEKYAYQIMATTADNVSLPSTDVFYFRAPPKEPVSSNDNIKTNLLYFADQGAQGHAVKLPIAGAAKTNDQIIKEIETGKYDLVLLGGDISYATGYEYVWDMYLDMIQPWATQVPLMVALGNHEYCYKSTLSAGRDQTAFGDSSFSPGWGNFADDSQGECGTPTVRNFQMPKPWPQREETSGAAWYSFNHGLIHFITSSSEHDWLEGSVQYKWLENDLKSVDRSLYPWVIIQSHRPMYLGATSPGDDTEEIVAKHFQFSVEKLLNIYRVNLFLTGHEHTYMRTCPAREYKCVGEGEFGTTHVIVGTAGFEVGTSPYKDLEWIANSKVGVYGYSRISADRNSLLFEFVEEGSMEASDSVTIHPYVEPTSTEYPPTPYPTNTFFPPYTTTNHQKSTTPIPIPADHPNGKYCASFTAGGSTISMKVIVNWRKQNLIVKGYYGFIPISCPPMDIRLEEDGYVYMEIEQCSKLVKLLKSYQMGLDIFFFKETDSFHLTAGGWVDVYPSKHLC